MSEVIFIFPHQLFKKHPAIKEGKTVYIIEEALFFNQYNFHQKKILLHRASMQYYKDLLEKKGCKVKYVAASSNHNAIADVVAAMPKSVSEIHYAEVTDDWLQRRLATAAAKKRYCVSQLPDALFFKQHE